MNADSGFDMAATNPVSCERADLLAHGFDTLAPFLEDRDRVLGALQDMAGLGDETATRLSEKLSETLEALEPTITMIGQVKAGKTTLVNAMAGWPGLLPADVNPWTSVVTSLHLSPTPPVKDAPQARFRFFSPTEWDRLLQKGGRIGELANRAGHADEVEKVRAQVEKMREKSRTRLGRRFEMLLGQEHEYGRFDQELIERYVCLGDDFDDEDANENQGRFADITKSAELQIHRPEFPLPICIRDTPGVNDTFMMREQITIRAIRDSRICVVVLSAHQALSTVDMALIRLITNIRSREVIIFVNRIDELSDPPSQVTEIEDSIRRTLKDHGAKEDIEIVFGSATWANAALTAQVAGLAGDSARTLAAWLAAGGDAAAAGTASPEAAWEASGVPGLYRACAARIAEGEGREALTKAARTAMNLASSLGTATGAAGLADAGELRMETGEIEAELSRIGSEVSAALEERLGTETEAFSARLERAHRSFLERATASLIGHLETKGEATVWKYEPTGLRLLLRSAYQVFGARTLATAEETFGEAAEKIGALYARAFDGLSGMEIAPPPLGHVPPPVVIGQTIALDIQGNWWRNWWRRRRGYESFATEFYGMIEAETAPIVEDLRRGQAGAMRERIVGTAVEFIEEQRQIVLGMAERQRAVAAGEVLVLSEADQKRTAVEDTLAVLRALAA